jgi:hypothetical protein
MCTELWFATNRVMGTEHLPYLGVRVIQISKDECRFLAFLLTDLLGHLYAGWHLPFGKAFCAKLTLFHHP